MAVASVLGALAAGALQTWYQDRLQDENTADAYQRNQQAQRNSPLNTLSGIRASGMNPALTSGGSFSAPQTNALPVSQSQIPNFMEMAKIQQEQKLVDAQANLLNAQATGVNRKNKVELDEDLSFNSGLRGYIEQQANSDSQNAPIYRSVLESNDVFSSGTYSGLDKVLSLIGKNDDSVVRGLSASLQKKVLEFQNTNEFAKILADIPRREQAQALADLSKVYAEIFKLSTDSRVSEETIKKVVAETSKILVDMNADYHKDFVGMVKNKDYFGAFMSLGYSALNAAASGAPYMVMPSGRYSKKAFSIINNLPSVGKAPKGSRSPAFPK